MIEFKRTNQVGDESTYAVMDGENAIAVVKTQANLISSIEFSSKESEVRYGEFTVRSIVFVLRDKFPEVKSAFVDERLKRLGFSEKNGGMVASSIKISFDNCGGCL